MRQLVDDNGNITHCTYDSLNRQTVMTFHDGSTRTSVYNQASDVVLYTDENGSEFTSTFDAAGRKTAVSISLASGVIDTTAQSFQYDGLDRTTFARDSVGTTHADVTLVYDSLSRVLEDSQTFDGNTRSVTNEKFTSFPMTQFAFPNGRQLTNTFDALYRRTVVANTGGSLIAAWQFFGTGRVAECVLGNGLIQTAMNNDRTRSARQENLASPTWGDQSSDRLGYDGAGRMIAKRFLAGGINGGTGAYNNTSSLVGQTTMFDKGSNKLYERELHAESRSHLYEPFDDQMPQGGYDSLDRLRQYQRGVLSSTGGQGNAGGGRVTTPISLPATDESRIYDLDGLGNWHHTVYTPVGDSQIDELRQHNGLNQITTVNDGGGNVPFSYDLNGNLLNDGIHSYEWDALNRLKRVYKNPTTTPVLIGSYDYDALNRRIRKVISNNGLSGTITNGTTDFLYNSDWQCVEERNDSNQPVKQYVWGRYIDELLQQRNDPDGSPEDFYPLQDLLYRTTALTDGGGAIVETYDCDAYGNTLTFNAPGAGGWWADDASQTDQPTCDFIFTGRRFDVENGLYQYRMRYYNSGPGRFLSRDPIGFRHGAAALYQYASSDPGARLDPAGLRDCYCCPEDCAGLASTTAVINFIINTVIDDSLRAPISDPGRLQTFVEETIRTKLATDQPGTGLANMTWIETRIRDIEKHKTWRSKEQFVKYGIRLALTANLVQTADCIKITCGNSKYCIGTDKIGHFFQQGYMLFEIKRSFAIRTGLATLGEQYAEAFSAWTEGLPLPADTPLAVRQWLQTGTFQFFPSSKPANLADYHRRWGPLGGQHSKHDLEANRQGMRFYWSFNPSVPSTTTFDICKYINKTWEECK